MSAENRAVDILVLLEHRKRLEDSISFEQFKEAQIKLLDYLIDTQQAKLDSEKAFGTFMDGTKP